MKITEAKIQRFLFICTIVISSIMFLVSVISMATGKAKPGKNLRKSDPEPENFISEFAVFNGFQQLRLATADNPPVPVIITPYLTYTNGDTELNEELNMKMRHFRTIFADYFSSHTQKELTEIGEQNIKAEITEKLNSELVLGKIINLYFSEYIFLN
jgi:flagellar FliL protein